jgi:signal transduction histidine kinase
MQNILDIFIRTRDRLFNIFGGRNIALLAITIAIAIAMMIINDRLIFASKNINDQITSFNQAAFKVSSLQKDLIKAESAQRGFLLTRSKEYLSPYDQAIINVRINLEEVENILKEQQPTALIEETELIDIINKSIEAKITELNLTLSLAKEGEFNNAESIVNLDNGLVEMENFDTTIGKLQEMLKKRVSDLQVKRSASRNLIRISVIAGPLILIFFVTSVIKSLLIELSEKAELQNQLKTENLKHELKVKEQSKLLQSLALDYQSDAERERQKLARELHDELGSILTATKMDIAWVIKMLKKSEPEIVDKLKRTNTYLDQGINFKRQIVQDLHPSMISTFGFWPALKTLIEETAERNQLALTLTLPGEDTQVNETISLIAYRVIQETLNNCSKYANASKLVVHIYCDENNMKIEIKDDGVGIDMNNLTHNTHGLSGMRHRVTAIGGHIELSSTPGEGLLTMAILPLYIKTQTV